MLFRDRADAGRQLAAHLRDLAGRDDVVVLALPRGGVPVAYEVAQTLGAPLDVFVVRKLGVPWQPELAMGAIASGGTRVMNAEVLRSIGLSEQEIEDVTARERQEMEAREQSYRGLRPPLDLKGRTTILVDDGLATGSTMRAAALAVRQHQPARVIIAVPVAAVQTCEELRREGNEVICVSTPEPFLAVGQWYCEFTQTTDEEVRRLLEPNG